MLYEINIFRNAQGFYDLLVNGDVTVRMLAQEDIAECVAHIMQDPDKFVEEMVGEDL